MDRCYHRETRLVHAGTVRSPFGETSEALFFTSGFVYDRAATAEARFKGEEPGYTYSRLGNPTVRMFERRMAALEGSEDAAATASGMAAITAVLMSVLRSGDRVVASRLLFGSTLFLLKEFLPRFGIETELVDATDLDAWEKALSRPARLVLVESPANPTLEIVDIRTVAELAHAAGALLVVDNVLATPVLQHPLELGADVVVYSATKHIDGHGRCLGGVICCSAAFRNDVLVPWLRHAGPSLSPFNAWVLLKSLESLPLRVRRASDSALRIARFLEDCRRVERVLYPGLASHPQHTLAMLQMEEPGPVLSFYTGGGKARAFAVLDRLKLIRISNNLGDAKTLATHPATTTHSRLPAEERARLRITDDLIRISVGLEHPDDLIEDLEQALR